MQAWPTYICVLILAYRVGPRTSGMLVGMYLKLVRGLEATTAGQGAIGVVQPRHQGGVWQGNLSLRRHTR